MSTLEQTLESLQRRVAALEAENAALRQQPVGPSLRQGASRRQVLVGGAGVLGALAGSTLLGRGDAAHAASGSGVAHAATPAARPQASLRVQVTPLHSRGVYWAQHEWDLGAHFRGQEAPVVVATAVDDSMTEDVRESCTCSVTVHGTPGAYRATLHVRNVSSHARLVTVHAIALGD